MLPALVFCFSSMVASIVAAPFQAEAMGPGGTLVVVDPKITSPTQDTVWVVGNQYNVTWDNSNLPPLVNITNVQGEVVLGQFNGDGEKLYLDSPLAQGFLITDSHVVITAPKVNDGNYMIVLFGDSGNESPQFKIVNNPLSSILGTQSTSTPASSTSRSSSMPSSTSTTSSQISSSVTSESFSESGDSASVFTMSSPLSTSHSSNNTTASMAPTLSAPTSASQSSNAPSSSQPATSAAPWLSVNFLLFAFTSAAISVVLAL